MGTRPNTLSSQRWYSKDVHLSMGAVPDLVLMPLECTFPACSSPRSGRMDSKPLSMLLFTCTVQHSCLPNKSGRYKHRPEPEDVLICQLSGLCASTYNVGQNAVHPNVVLAVPE
jgi:hypothetical protein